MSLTAGTRLGPYEIVAPLGAGGMGEVYRATDTNLKRDVALKVLPASVSSDPDRLARFQREAEVLAALNHPNIAQIYGLERSSDVTGLVMELVEGPTLADAIASNFELRSSNFEVLEWAMPIARQIARALEAAHESGIIHRDLKPANIKVRPDGTVKVLDFGLAKALDPGGESGIRSADPAQSPTMTSPAMTAMGMILGTAAYMSPEQARGKPVDRRADVWAFGCVLYEMLTGQRPFEDEDVSLTLSKVLQRDPDFEAFPPAVPAHVRHVVRLCLRKDPRERIPDIATARMALDGLFAAPAGDAPSAAQAPARPVTAISVAIVALALVLGAAAGRFLLAPAPRPQPLLEFDITSVDLAMDSGSFALAPDGSRLAFVGRDDTGVRHLLVRDMDLTEPRVLPGTEGAVYPFWSPDGREIGFFSGQQLLRIALDGAAARPVATVSDPRGGAWTDGDIILVGSGAGPIWRVPATGGQLEPMTEVESGMEDTHAWPAFLPDGRRFVFLADASSDEGHRVWLASLDGEAPRILKSVVRSQPVVDPSGRLLLSERGQLVAYPFDLDSGTIGTETTLVDTQVHALGNQHGLPVSAAAGGMLAFQHTSSRSHLVFVDHAGRVTRTIGEPDNYGNVTVSPDGQRLGYEIYSDASDERLVWVHDLARGVRTPVSPRGALADSSQWSPDSQTVYFDSNATGVWEAYRVPVTGGGSPEPLGLPAGAIEVYVLDVSLDGRWMLGAARFDGRQFDLYLRALDGGGEWTSWLESPGLEDGAVFSPDSRWIAYASDALGRQEVYVASVTGGPAARRWPISSDGGLDPRFSPDGRTLYYRSPNFDWMAVDVTLGDDTVEAGTPRALFGVPDIELPFYRNLMDALPDGSGFVTLHPVTNEDLSIRVRTRR